MTIYKSVGKFLSTPSARRATPSHVSPLLVTYIISIHALREEGDCPPLPAVI